MNRSGSTDPIGRPGPAEVDGTQGPPRRRLSPRAPGWTLIVWASSSPHGSPWESVGRSASDPEGIRIRGQDRGGDEGVSGHVGDDGVGELFAAIEGDPEEGARE